MTKRNRTRRKQARKAIREYKSIVKSLYYENTETIKLPFTTIDNFKNMLSFSVDLSGHGAHLNMGSPADNIHPSENAVEYVHELMRNASNEKIQSH